MGHTYMYTHLTLAHLSSSVRLPSFAPPPTQQRLRRAAVLSGFAGPASRTPGGSYRGATEHFHTSPVRFDGQRLLGDGLTSELAGRLSSPSRWLFAVSLLLVSAYYLVVGAHFWSPLHNVVGCINCNSSQSTVVSVS
ncbi:hypothetical protein OsJ_28961 [Oryza sativa Japonica Group]|uniref:Uncharacterized protein n=1 Tax=Oryza sativa subsp. japonica TaxID=39947 RepID=A3BXP6_ORYSJ|nr:hypothetical protein OsJ_28961 [Oryza sativa Japonica Group]